MEMDKESSPCSGRKNNYGIVEKSHYAIMGFGTRFILIISQFHNSTITQ